MNKPLNQFTVKFKGKGISPDTVPLRVAVDAMTSVYRIAINAGDDDDVRTTEDQLNLLRVKKGSASFACQSTAVDGNVRLGEAGKAIKAGRKIEDELLDVLYSPIHVLSGIAKRLNCVIEVLAGTSNRLLATFQADTFSTVVKGRIARGETSFRAKIERVGGVTADKCVLRLPDRRRLLYCDVAAEEVTKQLASHLYQFVTVKGFATWIGSNWRIKSFSVSTMVPFEPKPIEEFIHTLRESGGKAWDDIADVDEILSRG